MIKKIVIGLIGLMIIIGGLVGIQWIVFYKDAKNTEKTQNINLEIETGLVHKNGQLFVTQTVSKLAQNHFLIRLPLDAKSVECILADKETLTLKDGASLQRIDVGANSFVTFNYKLPVDESKSYGWFETGFVQFFTDDREAIAANFHVTVSEETDKSITWISGAVSEAQVDKEYLTYFAWTKNNTTEFPLYMSKEPLKKIEVYEPNIYLFIQNRSGDESLFTSFKDWYKRLPDKNGLTIIQANDDQVYLAPLLVVVPKHIDKDKLEELAIQAYLLNYKKPKTDKISWVWNVLPAFILERPVGQNKEFEMSKELLENLKQDVKMAFADWLLKNNNNYTEISLENLDEQLSKFSQLQTMYFTENDNKDERAVPLYYVDRRQVYYGQRRIGTDWNTIIKKKEIYFPFVETMERIGFKIQYFPESQVYLLTKEENSWKFYLNEKKYNYNQQEFMLTNLPLEEIGENVYISEQMIESLLKIEVIKREQTIYLR
ncbi:MAG TPA: hypothetical protein GX497_15025 [Bacillus bacterium]|nr:hypothetical protein [Bacillus sp. (in: firmicutes)]